MTSPGRAVNKRHRRARARGSVATPPARLDPADKISRVGPLGWWGRLRRPRLTSGLLVGLAVYAALIFVPDLSWRLRFISAWDVGASFALLLLFVGLRKSPPEAMKRNALRQDAGKWAVLFLSLLAAVAGLVVIAAEMPLVKNATGLEQGVRVIFVIYTIVLSWAFIHTVFALHYAHDYYTDVDLTYPAPSTESQRLIFPGGDPPTYGDFLYFAFTVGMTFQVSDVQVADARLRRVVILHGATGFFYSTGILALTINLVAGLL
jgi:uncharacterized membrane protein